MACDHGPVSYTALKLPAASHCAVFITSASVLSRATRCPASLSPCRPLYFTSSSPVHPACPPTPPHCHSSGAENFPLPVGSTATSSSLEMARGRGSASSRRAFAVACCFCCILAGLGVADAATTYYVGDGSGWSFSSASWPNGKQFHAGDVLVFRYIPWVHNVVAVDEDGYNGCTTPPGSRTYTSGSDSVRLARGNNYFICTRFGHCNLGMKLVVNAA